MRLWTSTDWRREVPRNQDNPEMHVDLMFPSRYLRAADFLGKPAVLTIAEVFRDKVQMANGTKQEKYVLRFKETDKELILNKTNAKAVAKLLHEPKAVNWPGERITLKPTTCEAFGEIVDCIRVDIRDSA
jgi:hypothetical protein